MPYLERNWKRERAAYCCRTCGRAWQIGTAGNSASSVPSLTGYPFQWFWDSCFHALALLHLDPEQAKKEMRTLMSGARPSGFIPHITFWEMEKQPDFLSRNIVGMTELHYSATIQPPIIAYTVARVYRVDRRRRVPAGGSAHPDSLLPLPAGSAGPGRTTG